jgi:hypothetical protein
MGEKTMATMTNVFGAIGFTIALIGAQALGGIGNEPPPDARDHHPSDRPHDVALPATVDPFEAWDSDGDDAISPAEWNVRSTGHDEFARVDADGDGKVSRIEWSRQRSSTNG